MRITWKKRMLSLALCLLMVFPLIDWKPIEGKAHGFWDDNYHIHTPACYPDYKISCGIEQGSETNHVHSLECFTYDDSKGPICGLEEGPIEDKELYTQNHVGYFLSCEIEEHIHSDSCYTWKQVIKRESTGDTPPTNGSVEVPVEDPVEDSNTESPSIDGPIEDPIEDTNEEPNDIQSPSTEESTDEFIEEPVEEPSTVTEDTPSTEEPEEPSIVTEGTDSAQESAEPSEVLEDDNPLTGDLEDLEALEEPEETPPSTDGYIEDTEDTEKDQAVTPSIEKPTETLENSIENNSETSQEPQPITPSTQAEQTTPEPDIDSIVADLESPEYPAFVTETIYEDEVPEDAIYGTGEYEGLIRGTLLCTKEEHTHTYEDCPTRELTEWRKVYHRHHHTFACYDTYHTVCGLDEDESHYHTLDCYEGEGKLLCNLYEGELHQHNSNSNWNCVSTSTVLICNNTDKLHSHTESCFEEIYRCRNTYAIDNSLPLLEDGLHHHTAMCYAQHSYNCHDQLHVRGRLGSHNKDCFICSEHFTCDLKEGEPHEHNTNGYVCEKMEGTYSIGEYAVPLWVCRKDLNFTEDDIKLDITWDEDSNGTNAVTSNNGHDIVLDYDKYLGTRNAILNITTNKDIPAGYLEFDMRNEDGNTYEFYSNVESDTPVFKGNDEHRALYSKLNFYDPDDYYDANSAFVKIFPKNLYTDGYLQEGYIAGEYIYEWRECTYNYCNYTNFQVIPAGSHISVPIEISLPEVANEIHNLVIKYSLPGVDKDITLTCTLNGIRKSPHLKYFEHRSTFDYDYVMDTDSKGAECNKEEVFKNIPQFKNGDLIFKCHTVMSDATSYPCKYIMKLAATSKYEIVVFDNYCEPSRTYRSYEDAICSLPMYDQGFFFYVYVPKEDIEREDNKILVPITFEYDLDYLDSEEDDFYFTEERTLAIAYSVKTFTGSKYLIEDSWGYEPYKTYIDTDFYEIYYNQSVIVENNNYPANATVGYANQLANPDWERWIWQPRTVCVGIDSFNIVGMPALTSQDFSIPGCVIRITDLNIYSKKVSFPEEYREIKVYIKKDNKFNNWELLCTREIDGTKQDYWYGRFENINVTFPEDVVAFYVEYPYSNDNTKIELDYDIKYKPTTELKELLYNDLENKVTLCKSEFLYGYDKDGAIDSLENYSTINMSSFAESICEDDRTLFKDIGVSDSKFILRSHGLKYGGIDDITGHCSGRLSMGNLSTFAEDRFGDGTSSSYTDYNKDYNGIAFEFDPTMYTKNNSTEYDEKYSKLLPQIYLDKIDNLKYYVLLPENIKYYGIYDNEAEDWGKGAVTIQDNYEGTNRQLVCYSVPGEYDISSRSVIFLGYDPRGSLQPGDYECEGYIDFYIGDTPISDLDLSFVSFDYLNQFRTLHNYLPEEKNYKILIGLDSCTVEGEGASSHVFVTLEDEQGTVKFRGDLDYGDSYTYCYNYTTADPVTNIVMYALIEDDITAGCTVNGIRVGEGKPIPQLYGTKENLHPRDCVSLNYTYQDLENGKDGWTLLDWDNFNAAEYKNYAFFYKDVAMDKDSDVLKVYVDMVPPVEIYTLNTSENVVFGSDTHTATKVDGTYLGNKVIIEYITNPSIIKNDDWIDENGRYDYTIDTKLDRVVYTGKTQQHPYFIFDNIEEYRQDVESHLCGITINEGNTEGTELYLFKDWMTIPTTYSEMMEMVSAKSTLYNDTLNLSNYKAICVLVTDPNLLEVNIVLNMMYDWKNVCNTETSYPYNANEACILVNDYGDNLLQDDDYTSVYIDYNFVITKGVESISTEFTSNDEYSGSFDCRSSSNADIFYTYNLSVNTLEAGERDLTYWDIIESATPNDVSSFTSTLQAIDISEFKEYISEEAADTEGYPEVSLVVLYSEDCVPYSNYKAGQSMRSKIIPIKTAPNKITFDCDVKTLGVKFLNSDTLQPLTHYDNPGTFCPTYCNLKLLMKFTELPSSLLQTSYAYNNFNVYATIKDTELSRTSNTTIVEIIPDDPVYLPFAGGTTTLPVYTIGTTLILGSWLAIKKKKELEEMFS